MLRRQYWKRAVQYHHHGSQLRFRHPFGSSLPKRSPPHPHPHPPNPPSSSFVAQSSLLWFPRMYLEFLKKQPVVTKSITAGIIYTLADLTSQEFSKLQADDADYLRWDAARTARMSFAGLVIAGPTLHLWFNFLSRIIPKQDILSVAKKMILGQTTYGPIFLVTFFSLNAYAQGENTEEVIARLKRDFFPTIKSGLMYWPLCDFLTYRYVPVNLQPLVNNSFSFFWTIYITYMASLQKAGSSSLPLDA